MTPQEEAIKLRDEFYNEMNPDAPDCNISLRQATQCAIIAQKRVIEKLNYEIDTTVYESDGGSRTFLYKRLINCVNNEKEILKALEEL